MSKEIMLMEDVAGLGREGDIVEVADGYARNYLLPKRLGAPVTNATRRFLEKREKEREAEGKELLAAAKKMAKRLEQISCTIPMKTGKDDKLFGSVHAANILSTLEGQGFELGKDCIVLDEPLDSLGIFEVPVNLHPNLTVALKVWVVKE